MYELVALYIHLHAVCTHIFLLLYVPVLEFCLFVQMSTQKRQCVLFANSTGNQNFCIGIMIIHDNPIKMIFTDFYQHLIYLSWFSVCCAAMASIKQKEAIFNHGQLHCWLGHPSESKTSYVVCAHSPMKSEVNDCHTPMILDPHLRVPLSLQE